MQRLSDARTPACHLGHVSGPGGHHTRQRAVWICEYPYRTMRTSGPSAECGDCPIWQAMRRERGLVSETEAEVLALEALVAS